MTKNIGFAKRFFLLATPLIATSTLATSPSQAATLALSKGEFYFSNFSFDPEVTATVTNANTLAIANGGKVLAENNTETNFFTDPPEASDSSLSKAFGESKNYLGLAKTEAKVLGNFFVDAGESFSVDFTAAFDLETSIDETPKENATASADISFLLFDTSDIADQNLLDDFFSNLLSDTTPNIKKSPLDFFSLSGNLNSVGDNDFITSKKSQYVTLFNQDSKSSFGGKAEFATAFVSGSLQRSFVNSTNLTLIQLKRNQARVSVPESSNSIALLLFCALVVVATKARREASTLQRTR